MARRPHTVRTSRSITLGGGCHWCTEAIFQALRGVAHVDQGWASALDDPARFSEAVRVHFDPALIPLAALVTVHLHIHSCTADHALRRKYRSAVYLESTRQRAAVEAAIAAAQTDFPEPILTEVIRRGGFRQNRERYLDYYRRRPEAPFCRRHIHPKLEEVRRRFARYANPE